MNFYKEKKSPSAKAAPSQTPLSAALALCGGIAAALCLIVGLIFAITTAAGGLDRGCRDSAQVVRNGRDVRCRANQRLELVEPADGEVIRSGPRVLVLCLCSEEPAEKNQ